MHVKKHVYEISFFVDFKPLTIEAAIAALIQAAVAFAAHVKKLMDSESEFVTFKEPRNRFRHPMYPGGPVRQIGLLYRPARAGNRFLGSLKGLQIRTPTQMLFTIPGFDNVQHIYTVASKK
jgi:hypothetical protein